MIEILFPLGVENYLIGGVLVGIGIAIPFIFSGLIAGVSTVFTSTWSYVLKGSFFRQDNFIATRHWRIALAFGLFTGGLLYFWLFNNSQPTVTTLEPWRLLLGGMIVGVGTRMGGGCTSGHGICGVAALNKDSIIATVVFLSVAILVANLTTNIF